MRHTLLFCSIAILATACSSNNFTMVTTTEDNPWVETTVYDDASAGAEADIIVDLDRCSLTVAFAEAEAADKDHLVIEAVFFNCLVVHPDFPF